MSITTPARRREFTGRHMALLAVGFFGVIIAVNVTMAVIASTSWTGLVVENSYVASQEFEAKRLAHAAQLEAGWTTSLDYAGGNAVLTVRDATGKSVRLRDPVLQLNRPVGGHDDQHVSLILQPDGSYAAPVTLGPGVWEAVVDAPQTKLGPLELHERFRIEEGRQ